MRQLRRRKIKLPRYIFLAVSREKKQKRKKKKLIDIMNQTKTNTQYNQFPPLPPTVARLIFALSPSSIRGSAISPVPCGAGKKPSATRYAK